MNKKYLIPMVLGLAALLGASCAVVALDPAAMADAEASLPVRAIAVTGEPAVDAASIFYTDEELANLNLTQDEELRSRVVASNTKLSVTVNGPLSDGRLVRGRKLAVSALRGSAAPAGETYQVYYGIDPSRLYDYKDLVATGYGNMVAIFDLPYTPTSTRFYYYVKGNKGTIFNNNGIPFSLPIVNSATSVRLTDGRLTVNYSGPAAGDGCWLHRGWNNWTNVGDVGMTYYGYSVAKYAQPGGYASVTIDAPSWANYLDFVVKYGSSTDNNGGKDWHYSLKPLVDVTWTDNSAGKKKVNIYYSAGSFNPPVAHYGINNWLETKDVQLQSNGGGQFSYTVDINPNAATVNACFRNTASTAWENNFGQNWTFTVN